jgi:hypothetical protein
MSADLFMRYKKKEGGKNKSFRNCCAIGRYSTQGWQDFWLS